jgi:hypothetical protein
MLLARRKLKRKLIIWSAKRKLLWSVGRKQNILLARRKQDKKSLLAGNTSCALPGKIEIFSLQEETKKYGLLVICQGERKHTVSLESCALPG